MMDPVVSLSVTAGLVTISASPGVVGRLDWEEDGNMLTGDLDDLLQSDINLKTGLSLDNNHLSR